jgi:1,4-alpha-glucan branching enzyme
MMAKPALALLQNNPELMPYAREISDLHYRYLGMKTYIQDAFGSLDNFSRVHEVLGFSRDNKKKSWIYREWAPGAYQLWLSGDFNNWSRESHPMEKNQDGIWEIEIPDAGPHTLSHGQKVKVIVHARNGTLDRIPACIRYAVQDEVSKDFAGVIWSPPKPYRFKNKFSPKSGEALFIYEAHTGMAGEAPGIGSYSGFKDHVLPRIKKAGYNCIQLMAVQEHPYYGSFGYHVSSFFAPSSRFGTPEELRELVDAAHGMGIAVIMDIVHSHAVKNIFEGLNEFDGTDHQYFRQNERGNHPSWDSKIFDYGKPEVMQFLLSNVRYWLEEFRFDGFRFDGVTSMLYKHHGLGYSFDHLGAYYQDVIDADAYLYLQLANDVAHLVNPACITIAEDVSGLPGLGQSQVQGGLGFDFRLGMGIPDFWIKIIKEQADESWNMFDLWSMLTNRRYDEKTISYAESHDQALVGDQTLAFRLMGAEMYGFMSKQTDSFVIDRGIALHKMIRLITAAAGGDGYLNFMGNEFGHPEWIDFPRAGNQWSYQFARRQWSLSEAGHLKYIYMLNFDRAMVELLRSRQVLNDKFSKEIHIDNQNKVLIFMRKGLIFAFNFHPENSLSDYSFHLPEPGSFRIILNSDDEQFGGFNRHQADLEHFTQADNKLSLYLTQRTALVLAPVV